MKFLRRIFLLLAVACLLPLSAHAAGNSITVLHTKEGTPIPGATFQLYRVDETYRDAQSAYNAVVQSGQAALATGVTDGEGKILFSNLENGSYLLTAQPHRIGDKLCEVEMSLLTIPSLDAEGKPTSNPVVRPKYILKDTVDSVEYRVLKLWEDDNAQGRPVSVKVSLYRNNTLYTTVELNKNNNWQYSWTETDPAAVWAVIEEVPGEYTAFYQREGNTFTITNKRQETPSKPTTPGPTTPEKPKLPQTGQLWWPVPVMGFAGTVLFLLGWIRRKESGDET